MKRKTFILLLLVLLLNACVRSGSTPLVAETPTGFTILTPTLAPDGPAATTQPPGGPPLEPPSITPTQPLAGDPDTATPAQFSATSTATSASEATATKTLTPTATEPPFDPYLDLGPPTWSDPMLTSSVINWVGESGLLPNTDYIRLLLQEDQLFVTGKVPYFGTQWFTWPQVGSVYLEMTVETDQCSGKDAYGLTFYGPPHGSAPGSGYGYVIMFSCDGMYLARRIDNMNPYTYVELIDWQESEHIASSSNQRNVMGIRAEHGAVYIYANGFKIGEFTDSHYLYGRYGVFVQAGPTPFFTYRVQEISYWDL